MAKFKAGVNNNRNKINLPSVSGETKVIEVEKEIIKEVIKEVPVDKSEFPNYDFEIAQLNSKIDKYYIKTSNQIEKEIQKAKELAKKETETNDNILEKVGVYSKDIVQNTIELHKLSQSNNLNRIAIDTIKQTFIEQEIELKKLRNKHKVMYALIGLTFLIHLFL